MKNRLLLLLGLLGLAALLLLTWMLYRQKKRIADVTRTPSAVKAPEEKLQQASPDTPVEVGDIALDLSMDYAKLKSLLREKEQPRSHTRRSLTNAVVLRWDRGVTATFLGDDPQDNQKPVGIRIVARGAYPKFQASICGVRLRDSLEQASTAMRSCGCRIIEKHPKSGTVYVDVTASCRLDQRLSIHFSDGRIASVLLWDKNYFVRPLDWPN